MLMLKVLAHPLNKVVFEYAFDELVEEVRSYQFMDVCAGEILGERLGGCRSQHIERNRASEVGLAMTPSTIPYFSHSIFGVNASLQAPVCSGDRKSGSISSRFPGGDAQLWGLVVANHPLYENSKPTMCTTH